MSLQTSFNDFRELQKLKILGSVKSYDGMTLETDPFPASVGSICKIFLTDVHIVFGEVIKVTEGANIVSLYESNQPIKVGNKVEISGLGTDVAVGEALKGRVIDSRGNSLDNLDTIVPERYWPLHGKALNPLLKTKINEPLDVGIRSINAGMTIGKGQRIGVVSGSGVGKSSLITMMTEFTKADVVVIGLIGERAREVADFVYTLSKLDSFKKSVIVAEPASSSPLLRIKGAQRATAIAEYFQSEGKDVLLIMDSLTRVAHAQREIGLSRGEATIHKGYTPSVLSLLPKLIERVGTGYADQGTITAIYTVLADGDDVTSDPIVDTSRAILDGHIILSRSQAAQGIYPAVDLTLSISRVMKDLITGDKLTKVNRLRALISTYYENRDLLMMGGYAEGQNEDLDIAIKLWPKITKFLQQDLNERSSLEDSFHKLAEIIK
ncbi:MAG: FliI/YscN family ATPase [Paracoccaceae bacterium]